MHMNHEVIVTCAVTGTWRREAVARRCREYMAGAGAGGIGGRHSCQSLITPCRRVPKVCPGSKIEDRSVAEHSSRIVFCVCTDRMKLPEILAG